MSFENRKHKYTISVQMIDKQKHEFSIVGDDDDIDEIVTQIKDSESYIISLGNNSTFLIKSNILFISIRKGLPAK